MDVKNKIQEYKAGFNEFAQKYINNLSGVDEQLLESMKYTLLNGGKRLRPIMMLAFCEMCGKNVEYAYPYALALEMVHTYSLIHDDLPCMDADKVRRGKPSNHVAFGESTALLAGDALLTQAFELISQLESRDSKINIKAVKILAQCAGASGMVSGQMLDLNMDYDKISESQVVKMYALKTASMFVAAAKIGVLIAGGNELQMKSAENYAFNFGLSFQFVDDILDEEEAILKCFEESPKFLVNRWIEKAKSKLSVFENDAEFLSGLADFLRERIY